MSADSVLDRLCAADPAPAPAPMQPDERTLLARIVAGPGDPRLGLAADTSAARAARRRPGRAGMRLGTRPIAFLVACVTLAAAGGAVGAVELGVFPHATPRALFRTNPAALFPGAPRQVVIPRTVRRATTFTVPGVGTFEWWIALSRQGWLCEAIRQPDGTWADLGDPSHRYQVSGPIPGCGKFPWHDARGFAYWQTNVRSPDGDQWRIAYGYVPTAGGPVTVRDRISGATARIGDGRYFAIVMPLCRAARCRVPGGTPPGPYFPGYQLQTLSAEGRVLVTDAYDPGM